MAEERWGVGNQADSKAFGYAKVGKQRVDLIHGEHPHSRRDNTTYARWPNGDIEGFNGHRIQTRVEVETHNYLKTSGLSGNEVRRSATCKIWLNDFLAYTFSGRDPDRLLRKAADQILPQLFEHAIQFWDPAEREKLIGRKVYYANTPAVVREVFWDQGCVWLEVEEGHEFPQPAWSHDPDGIPPDDDYRTSVKDDFFAPSIYWHRD
jgi:hypothetical protein